MPPVSVKSNELEDEFYFLDGVKHLADLVRELDF